MKYFNQGYKKVLRLNIQDILRTGAHRVLFDDGAACWLQKCHSEQPGDDDILEYTFCYEGRSRICLWSLIIGKVAENFEIRIIFEIRDSLMIIRMCYA